MMYEDTSEGTPSFSPSSEGLRIETSGVPQAYRYQSRASAPLRRGCGLKPFLDGGFIDGQGVLQPLFGGAAD